MRFHRRPAVAGMFYPDHPDELTETVRRLMADTPPLDDGPPPKAVIAPHAGYPFSGPVAARVYARLAPLRGKVRRVVLMGPSHQVPFRGFALTSAAAYDTPLGPVPVDREAAKALAPLPQVQVLDEAHAPEHSLEVHLPFLRMVLGDFALVPVVAGRAAPEETAEVLEALWGGPETLVVVSSDLSHYLDYQTCKAVDARTAEAIEALAPHAIGPDQACGCVPIGGLLLQARKRGLDVERVDLRCSGDTAGPRGRVVGYGAWAFTEKPSGKADHAPV